MSAGEVSEYLLERVGWVTEVDCMEEAQPALLQWAKETKRNGHGDALDLQTLATCRKPRCEAINEAINKRFRCHR